MSMSLQLSIPYTTPVSLNFHLLKHRRLCHLANTLKHNVNKRTVKISTSGIAIVSTLYGYSRQRRTIGSFSATAGLLVIFKQVSCDASFFPISSHLSLFFSTPLREESIHDGDQYVVWKEGRRMMTKSPYSQICYLIEYYSSMCTAP